MEAKHITEARWLSIPLFCAERAWSYGMELKHELKEGDHPRYRFRLIKRFAKVTLHTTYHSSLSLFGVSIAFVWYYWQRVTLNV
jgi:hypothetical protein